MTDEEQRHHDYVCAAMASMTQRGLECDHMPADIAQAAKAVADAMMTATGKPDDKEKPKYAHPTKDAVIESLRTQLGRAQRIAMDTERDHDAEIQGLKDQTKDDKKFIEQATNEMAHLRQVVYNCGSPLTHPEREIARLRTVMRQKDLTITLREDELQKAYTKYYDLQHKTDEATAKPDDKVRCPVCGDIYNSQLADKDAEIARLTTELENEGQVHAMFDQQQPEIDRLRAFRDDLRREMLEQHGDIDRLKKHVLERTRERDNWHTAHDHGLTEIARLAAELDESKLRKTCCALTETLLERDAEIAFLNAEVERLGQQLLIQGHAMDRKDLANAKALEALKSIRQTIPPEHPAEYSEFTTIRNVTTAAIKLLEAE